MAAPAALQCELIESLRACIEVASGLLQSGFAKLPVFVVLFAGTFLKSFSFPVNVYERVYILLAFHAFNPPIGILLFRPEF